ncbi:MAG: HK97 gp10 family phage protein [Patescibacteria group bacterium]|nr:HK97 gp10 family phage protein [Patescibacteria group bacterium]
MITLEIKGLNKMQSRFDKAPSVLKNGIKKAIGRSLEMVETESKRRTPVDTGLLRSSIGGVQGFKSIGERSGKIGTNVKYALAVHEGSGRHRVGENKFMEKGLDASLPFIKKTFKEILNKI